MKTLVGWLIMPWSTALRGLVLVKLWHWFLVPLGLHDIRIPVALGISLIVSFLTMDLWVTREKTEWLHKIIISSIISLCALGFGWIYQLFL